MARFLGFLIGRTKARVTRLGDSHNTVTVGAQGWHIGAHIKTSVDDDQDTIRIFLNSGSSQDLDPIFLGSFTRSDLEYLQRHPTLLSSTIRNLLNSE